MARSPTRWLLPASERLYRLLLLAYPAEFRREYGPQMVQVYHDCCRDALQRDGAPGLIGLWFAILGDLIATALKERFVEPQTRHVATSAHTEGGAERSKAMLRMFRRAAHPNQPFDMLTKRAKRALDLAAEEARALNHSYVGTEHILLGLIREEGGVAAKVLDILGVQLSAARHNVESIVGVGDQAAPECLAMTPRAKQAIAQAFDEANRLDHDFVGTEHLLLGLARAGAGAADDVLERMDLSPEQLRGEVLRVLRQGRS